MGMLSASDADTVVTRLGREGFSRVSFREDPDHFDDQQATWSDGDARVRLTRDRGEWWCDLSYGAWSDWFDLDLVAGFLESKEQAPEDRVILVRQLRDGLREPLVAYRSGARRYDQP